MGIKLKMTLWYTILALVTAGLMGGLLFIAAQRSGPTNTTAIRCTLHPLWRSPSWNMKAATWKSTTTWRTSRMCTLRSTRKAAR